MLTTILRALILYHLAEYQSGNATTIQVNVQKHTFKISDNGRGHAIDRTINGVSYLKLVYSQLDYPFDLDSDTPIQLHTIGISIINALCKELIVTVHKKENVLIQSYKDGKLEKEEIRENQEHHTGNTIEGHINNDPEFEETDLQTMEDWLAGIKSINQPLRLFFNGKEL